MWKASPTPQQRISRGVAETSKTTAKLAASFSAAVHQIPAGSGEALDKALAAYFHTRPTRVAFAKIGSGKFTYGGTRKLFLKFSEDKGIMVRTGGSLVPIEEFLMDEEGPPPENSGAAQETSDETAGEEAGGGEEEDDDLDMFAGMGNAYANV